MRRGVMLWGPLCGLVAIVSACGSGGDSDVDPVTTTTLSPAAQAAGREVCEAVFTDPSMLPSLERAGEAGPQLGRIVEDLVALEAEDAESGVTREEVVARLTTSLEAFEIVCENDYGVVAPPNYLDTSGS